jgi:hypothetical protein
MDLGSQLFLSLLTDGVNDRLRESFVNILLVIVDRDLGRSQVSDVFEHLNGILQCQQVVIHLVQP